MDKTEEHKQKYENNSAIDCPLCGQDRPEHSCRNCFSEMSKESCWQFEGYCSEKCRDYVLVHLPAKRKQKEALGVKCQCDDPYCGKCLGSYCQDKNCPTHTGELKLRWRERSRHGKKKK